jgi:hypothetical protein
MRITLSRASLVLSSLMVVAALKLALVLFLPAVAFAEAAGGAPSDTTAVDPMQLARLPSSRRCRTATGGSRPARR